MKSNQSTLIEIVQQCCRLCFCLFLICRAQVSGGAEKPNIVIILAGPVEITAGEKLMVTVN
ncbi:MAG: hypothetical protein IH623_19860 [Verrucomicrobia bacterium]|nr:hypothetical protein [Verrucomicrobiota bacterium]